MDDPEESGNRHNALNPLIFAMTASSRPEKDGPQRLARETVYESQWMTLHLDKVRLPSGKLINRHHVIDFPDSVAVVVVDDDGDTGANVLMIESYRYTIDSTVWEIPAGRVEKGESLLAAAKRETLEETGYDSVHHELLYTYNPYIGIATGEFGVVRCRATGIGGDFDHDEVKQVCWMAESEVVRMIADRQIYDGYSLTGLLLHFNGKH